MKHRDLSIVRDKEPRTTRDVGREGVEAVKVAQEAMVAVYQALEEAERILGVRLMDASLYGDDPMETVRGILSDLGYTFGGMCLGPK